MPIQEAEPVHLGGIWRSRQINVLEIHTSEIVIMESRKKNKLDEAQSGQMYSKSGLCSISDYLKCAFLCGRVYE